jgi:ribosomal protein S18 acetylase RimI-like enzyme
MSVLIRAAHDDELDAIGRATLEAYEASGILGSDPGYRAQLLDAASRHAAGEVLVAVVDHAVVGSVTYCPAGTAFAELSDPGEAEFRMLAVDPAARGRGVAKALIAACVERAGAEGLARLVLSVIAHNHAAAALYASVGFTRVPARDWRPSPGTLLEVWAVDLAGTASTSSAPGDRTDRWCGRCGSALVDGDHALCANALALEPPRYCARCRRRMVVQVLPAGWSARCSEHGAVTASR